MNDESMEHVELQLAHLQPPGAPQELRTIVLGAVHCQLNAQRWDRWVARIAAALVILGVGLNLLVGWRGGQRAATQVAAAAKPDVMVQVAVAVAEATDAEAANCFVRHLAELSGSTLSPEQAAAIQQEIQSQVKNSVLSRKEG